MKDKAIKALKYRLAIVGIIFIILCIIVFAILIILVKERENVPAYVMTSLEELEQVKNNKNVILEKEDYVQGTSIKFIDENKIEIGGEYEGEINITDYEPTYVYVSENTKYVNLMTSEIISKEDISENDILTAYGEIYTFNGTSYSKTYVDAIDGEIKVLDSSDYGKMRNDYFLNKKEIENVRMVSNRMSRRVSLAYDKEINGVIVPLVQIFDTNGNKIKEVAKSVVLDITLEEPLKENNEKKPGLIVDFKMHY